MGSIAELTRGADGNFLSVSPEKRWFAVGDPQTTEERFLSFLERAGVLRDRRLRPDVGLVSIGDHFDFGNETEVAAREGMAILRWLSSHPPDQVLLIAGNHDLSRVTELAFETDESFAAARALAERVEKQPELRDEFTRRFPRIPTPEIATRDYGGFREEQRTLVQELLLGRRFVLAAATSLGESPALLVHAGLSTRELDILGIPSERDPLGIARALNRWLEDAVARVAKAWQHGELAALELEPLHVAGAAGVEGGGLLYHRPVNSERPNRRETERDLDPARPRRFDARKLPRDLLQIVGHTAHKRSKVELEPWVSAAARDMERNQGHRTLRVDDSPIYDLGVLPHHRGAATVVMIDGGMSDDAVHRIDLLPIAPPQL